MTALIKTIVISLTFHWLLLCAQAFSAEVTVNGEYVSFSNRYLILEAGRDGLLKSVRSRPDGSEYLDRSVPQPFMYVKQNGREFGSSSIGVRENELTIRFDGSGVTAIVKVDPREDCFIFELVGVHGEDIESFGLARMHLTFTGHIGATLNIAFDENFGICLLGLNLQTHAEGMSRRKAILAVDCVPRFGMEGSRYALIGLPMDKMLPVIGALEEEYGLPHPMIDGEWNKVSRAVETSYLFTDGDQKNIEKCIDYAKAGGFTYLMLLGGVFSSYGHYEINTKLFPDSIEGLKATMGKIHAAGLKGGVHFLVGWVSKDDPYVTPVPDPRLAKGEKVILADDISEGDDFIPITAAPETFPAEPRYVGNGGCDLQIGDEIIFYTGLSKNPPYGFSGCKRGMHGTNASAHAKSDTVYHMLETWRHYVVGADTDMLEEMASRMGKIFNECGVDMLYFDGGETMDILGPAWYYIGKVKEAYFRHFKRDILYQGSGTHTYAWHIYARGNSDDWSALALKRFLDRHKVPNRVLEYHANLLPAEFGWWGYFTHSPSVDATLPDEVEYGYSKGAGYDTPVGFEPHMDALEGNGRTAEIFAMMKRWEEARLAGAYSGRMKEELRTLGVEHTLRQGENGAWNIHRIGYGPDHYVKTHVPSSFAWQGENPNGEQPLRLRIRAKCSAADFDDAGNIELTDFGDARGFSAASSDSSISMDISVSDEIAKAGEKSWRVSARNAGGGSDAWAMLEYRYPEPLSLLHNRAPGLWVHGDGGGAVLNVSLVESRGVMRRDHYIVLDFSGWKYFELSEPEADRVYDFKWPYGVKWPTRHFAYNDVGRIQFYITRVPERGFTTIYLSAVKALRDVPSEIVSPMITVNGSTVVFPVTLHDDEYIEYWGENGAKHYDSNNFLISEFLPEGAARLRNGRNDFGFACSRPETDLRAKIAIMAIGEALHY